jgi:hypothetical protein
MVMRTKTNSSAERPEFVVVRARQSEAGVRAAQGVIASSRYDA